MRLSEIGYKEIIDLTTGKRHGQLWDSELLFNRHTGEIEAILINENGRRISKNSLADNYRQLPWKSIVCVGDDMIIFQSDLVKKL